MANVFNQTFVDRAIEDSWSIERCRAGNAEAMRVLIDRHRTRITRIAHNILHDATEAEDVAQEAFIKGFREMANLREDRAFSGYLYRIVVRLCMDRLRARRTVAVELDGSVQADDTAVENKIIVHKLLNEMSPDLRLTLILREMNQLSYEEVAEAMNVPVGTVRSRLHTARDRFRQLWTEAMKEQP